MSTISRWRSDPPSIFGFAGIGYLTRSDSDAYWNDTLLRGVDDPTTLNGMP